MSNGSRILRLCPIWLTCLVRPNALANRSTLGYLDELFGPETKMIADVFDFMTYPAT